MAVDFHKQIQNMMTGGGSSSSSTTSFVSVVEGLATDTKKMLELQTRHFGVLEKLIGKGIGGGRDKTSLGDFLADLLGVGGKIALNLGKAVGIWLASRLGITAIGNLIKGGLQSAKSFIQAGALKTVKFVADKTFGAMRSVVSASASRITALFKASFDFASKSIPSISKIGAAISQYGIKFGTAVKNAFSGFSKATTAIESVSKIGNFFSKIGSIGSKFGKFFGKMFVGLQAITGGWDLATFDRSSQGVRQRAKDTASNVTDILSYIFPKEVIDRQRKSNESAAKAQEDAARKAINPLGWLLGYTTWDNKSLRNTKPAYINQNGVENLRHRRLSGFAAERRSQNNANIRLGTGVNPYITVDQNSAKSIANQALKNKSVTDAVAPALYSGNSVAMAVVAQMPSSMGDLFSEMRNALVRGATEMVRRYTELQAEAFAEQREDEEEARKAEERKARSGFFGRMSAFQGILGQNSLLSSIPGMDSSPSSPYSTSTNTSNNTTSSPQVKAFSHKNADGSYTVDGKTYAKESRQAKAWNATENFHNEMTQSNDWDDKLPEEKKVAILKRDLKKNFPNATDSQITAMVANMRHEGLLKAGQEEIGRPLGDDSGIGLMQWTRSRRKELEKYAASKGKHWSDYRTQMDFMKLEAEGKIGTEKKGYDSFFRETANMTPADATTNFMNNVERPSEKAKAQSNGRRRATAEAYASIQAAQESRKRKGFEVQPGKVDAGLGALVNETTRDKVYKDRSIETNPSGLTTVDGKNIPVPVYQDQKTLAGTRKLDVQDDVLSNVQQSVYRTLGEGYKVQVYSGGQDPKGKRTGSRRHNYGGAADLKIFGPDGKQISQEQYAQVAQLYLAENFGSIGMQMNGGGVHFDRFKRNQTPGSKDALLPGEGQFWKYASRLSKETQAKIQAGLKGQIPEGAMTKEEFLAKTTKSESTPTASLDSNPKDKTRTPLDTFDSYMKKLSVSKPTQNFVRPDLSSWPEQEKNKTLPDQVKANQNSAQNLIKKTEVDKKADTTQDTKVRVADVPPIDEYKVVMFNGSSFV